MVDKVLVLSFYRPVNKSLKVAQFYLNISVFLGHLENAG